MATHPGQSAGCAQRAAQGGVTESDRGPPAAAAPLWWEGQANRDLSTGPWPREQKEEIGCLQATQSTFYQCSRNCSHNSCLVFTDKKNRVPDTFPHFFNLFKCLYLHRMGFRAAEVVLQMGLGTAGFPRPCTAGASTFNAVTFLLFK